MASTQQNAGGSPADEMNASWPDEQDRDGYNPIEHDDGLDRDLCKLARINRQAESE